MIQALKCMSSEEESRFEAFRRCTLPIDAVRKVLVASLAEGIVRRSCMNHNEMIGNHGSSCNGKLRGKKYVGGVQILPKVVRDAIAKPENVKDWNKVLQCLVSPKESGDIAIIVSTLAKMYAQRVVNHACGKAYSESASGKSGAVALGGVQQYSPAGNLKPRHIFQAHLLLPSPMFYLEQTTSIYLNNDSATLVEEYKSKADAAIAAEKAYDDYVKQLDTDDIESGPEASTEESDFENVGLDVS